MKPTRVEESRVTGVRGGSLREGAAFLAWTAAFALAYSQSPLYTSNQNQYFLRGAARAGIGLLREDWLANTTDSTPVFTLLVELTLSRLHASAFYLYYALLMGVYLYSLAGIASRLFDLSSRAARLIFMTLLVVVHSAALRLLLSQVPGSHWAHLLEGGVAGQRLLGPVLQPSAFGALLVLSIHLFLRGRPFWAAACAALAATVHPTYLWSAALLTMGYMLVTVREGEGAAKALGIGGLALILVTPILLYLWPAFRPTSARLSAQALSLLAEERIPHHALISEWFDVTVILKLMLVGGGLYLSRGTKLFQILLLASVAAIGLTVVQVLTGSLRLALFFPWRPSTFLVPVSTALLLAGLATALAARLEGVRPRTLQLASLTLILATAAAGSANFAYDLQRRSEEPAQPAMRYVAEAHLPNAIYLIPPKLQEFRLATGAPAFVEFKSVPYRDVEVLEWYTRLRLARFFYRDQVAGIDCRLLDRAQEIGAVTHILLGPEQLGLACPQWEERYRDGAYAVYELN